MENSKPSFYELEVQFEEIDQGGVVYHPNYFSYLERARNDHMKKVDYPLKRMLEEGFVFALAHAELEFKRPSRLDEKLVVVTRILEIKAASILLEQNIYKKSSPDILLNEIETSGELCLKSTIKLGCIDLEKFGPMKIPQALRDKF